MEEIKIIALFMKEYWFWFWFSIILLYIYIKILRPDLKKEQIKLEKNLKEYFKNTIDYNYKEIEELKRKIETERQECFKRLDDKNRHFLKELKEIYKIWNNV